MKDNCGAITVGHLRLEQYLPVVAAVIARYGADHRIVRYALAVCTPDLPLAQAVVDLLASQAPPPRKAPPRANVS